MALSRYVITAPVIVPAGAPATSTAGEPGTGGAAGFGNTGISAGYAASSRAILLDPAGALYAAIGAGNRRTGCSG